MPRIISNEERELIKQSLQRASITLIKRKGLRYVTVDDITKATGIAKGSFYLYYQTKEELLYEVVKIAEKKAFDAILSFRFNEGDLKRNVETVLREIFLAQDSIALYIQPEDIEFFIRKFPAEIREKEKIKSQNNLSQIGVFFGLSETDSGTLAHLMEGLQYIATCNPEYGKASHQQSLDVLVHTIAEFIYEKTTKRGA